MKIGTYYLMLWGFTRSTVGKEPVRYGQESDKPCLITQALVSKCDGSITLTYNEARYSYCRRERQTSMKSKIESFRENCFQQLVLLPAGRKTICTKCIFVSKKDGQDRVFWKKSRLVANGFPKLKAPLILMCLLRWLDVVRLGFWRRCLFRMNGCVKV